MTLATDFIPGSNRKGKVSGANWLFLLPRLDIGHVICLGVPSPPTLATLSNLSQEAVLIVEDSHTLIEQDNAAERPDLPGVKRVHFGRDGVLALHDDYADLIFITGKEYAEKFNVNEDLRSELLRILARDGFVYVEGRERNALQVGPADKEQTTAVSNTPSLFWLTPLKGEMHTAVPHNDPATIAYFLQNNLTSPMFNVSGRMFKHAKRLAPGQTQLASANSSAVGPPQMPVSKRTDRKRPSLKHSARKAGLGLMEAAQRVEGLVDKKRLVRRYGMFYGGPPGESNACPPQYIRAIAQDDGLYLDTFRWGLSAGGEYSSRKLLFFLFDRDSHRGETQPDYIVKMVRDGSFNYRLDNEARSLKILVESGFSDPEALPQVVFAGHHAGLSIVGESIITGVPFRQATQATADCPHGIAALDWFVELGAHTADNQAAAPADIAACLTQLFNRFVEIYQPTDEQHDFLAQQIAKIGRSVSAVPLVFQHGDPGPWNMLVTPSGRVAVLDWEAAEPIGMPLWDLFYFMRSYSLEAARKRGLNRRLAAFTEQFLEDTPLSRLYIETIVRYCDRIGLDRNLIEPFFYTCWMHRSLKESMRLDPDNLGEGHFANLIWWCKERHDSPTLKRLFSLPAVPVL